MLQSGFADQVSRRIADAHPRRAASRAALAGRRSRGGASLGSRDRRTARHERRHGRPYRQGPRLRRARRSAARARRAGRTARRSSNASVRRSRRRRPTSCSRRASRTISPTWTCSPAWSRLRCSSRPSTSCRRARASSGAASARRRMSRATDSSCAGVSGTRAWRWSRPARRSPTSCSRCRSDDAVVVMAYGRLQSHVSVLLDHADTLGCPVVLITDDLARTLGTRVASLLQCGRGTSGLFSSHAGTLLLVEALVLAVAKSHEARAESTLVTLNEFRASLAAPRVTQGSGSRVNRHRPVNTRSTADGRSRVRRSCRGSSRCRRRGCRSRTASGCGCGSSARGSGPRGMR